MPVPVRRRRGRTNDINMASKAIDDARIFPGSAMGHDMIDQTPERTRRPRCHRFMTRAAMPCAVADNPSDYCLTPRNGR